MSAANLLPVGHPGLMLPLCGVLAHGMQACVMYADGGSDVENALQEGLAGLHAAGGESQERAETGLLQLLMQALQSLAYIHEQVTA